MAPPREGALAPSSPADLDDALRKLHVASVDLPVSKLECRTAWDGLTEQEKQYAHFFATAAWAGAKICAVQLSQESAPLGQLLLLLFSGQSVAELKARSMGAGVSEEEWKAFVAYAAAVFANLGNYLSFGDSKIIPGLPSAQLERILAQAALQDSDREHLQQLWSQYGAKAYSLEPGERALGLAPDGISCYYSPGIQKAEIDAVQGWMSQAGIEAWNTRIFRRDTPAGALPEYDLRIASAHTRPVESHSLQGGGVVHVVYGDHCEELRVLVDALKQALPHAANDNQKQMLHEYIRHFETGDIGAHKDSQRCWIKDQGPVVETNIGFIENYRDPVGSCAEFEGFVAVVNKEQSAKFGALVAAAPALLPTLPWPREFEKDAFRKPDFTSLEVVAFANGGIPAGINIPNYDDLRQHDGFKNVSLGNVLAAKDSDDRVPFLQDADQQLWKEFKGKAFEVQVGCHELLGHGSGKLFHRGSDGVFDFPHGSLANPETGAPVASWYEAGQSWDSVFGAISSSYEECRAECVGIFLAANEQVLSIFGHEGQEAGDVMYVNWLLMARGGLLALEMYTPETRAWRQAHMQARFAILNVFLRATQRDTSPGDPFVQVKWVGDNDAVVVLNRAKIASVGVPAVGAFLRQLQVFKATADIGRGGALYADLTTVSPDFLQLRRVVMEQKKPRPVFCQAHTVLDESAPGGVRLLEFDASHEGLIESSVARFGKVF
ncbi:Dipeptidyl peptidase III [Klebsormidium nitens]|uniref:Dipeptidyl peptidase 3 n=1 Tax=Klebsormidium nitens TaxID=105231 RepID=A0A1Y1IQH9_KLENI|nr:Dipeptidyl peptidase III [Klebsormidium nitens]|eukprot:GAQ90877.1 Dipeptidyl peptidase III [Klebsormidium nitens]